MKSTHAQVAALIKKELKKQGIKCKVKSSIFVGGDDVGVRIFDQPISVALKIEKYCSQFQAGRYSIDSDMYEYSNDRNDIPQVKYVSLWNELSLELKSEMYVFFKNFYNWEEFPETFQDAQKYQIDERKWESVGMFIESQRAQIIFWKAKRPRIRLQAA